MSSLEETFQIFNKEAEKLEFEINLALTKLELSFPEIVQIYYQTMNVNSLASVLIERLGDSDEHRSLTDKIEQTKRFILEKFDSNLHLLIMTQLTDSISNITKNLQSGNAMEKSKEDIESEAKLYEKLRETMSTKEFVEQYDKGLSHD